MAHDIGAPRRTSGAPVPAALLRDPSRRWWVLITVAVAQLMVVLSVTIANIALPQAQASLGMSDTERQWVITGYALAFGGTLLVGGRLGDLVGRRTALLVGLAGFALASAVAGAAPTTTVLVVARAVQGLAGAVLAPAALAVMTTTFTEPHERGRAFGVFSAISGAGAGIGLLAGGALTSALSWRWCFVLQVPFAALAALGTVVLLRHATPTARPRLDVVGAVLAAAGLVSLVLGTTTAGDAGWAAPRTLGPLAAGTVLLVVFVVVEARRPEPLLPLRVVADRDRAGSFLSVLFLALATSGVFFFVTFYLQLVKGYTALATGFAFMPMVLTIIVTSLLVNTRLLPAVGPRRLVSTGMLLGSAGLLLLSRLTPETPYGTGVVPGMVLIGLGYAGVLAPGMARATLGVLPQHAGAASGLVNTCQQIGLALGTALLSTIAVGVTGADSDPAAVVRGYDAAFATGAGVFVVGAVLAALLFRPHHRS